MLSPPFFVAGNHYRGAGLQIADSQKWLPVGTGTPGSRVQITCKSPRPTPYFHPESGFARHAVVIAFLTIQEPLLY